MKRAVLLFTVIVLGAAILGACGGSSGTDVTKLSAETRAYLGNAMPELEGVMSDWSAGKYEAAANRWKRIGDIPTSTAADEVMADDYLKYANNVRYYMLQDGSATMKDVEESKAAAEATLSGFSQ